MNSSKYERRAIIKNELWIIAIISVQIALCFILSMYAFLTAYDTYTQNQRFKKNYVDTKYYRIWDAFYNKTYDQFLSTPNHLGIMQSVYNMMVSDSDINFVSQYYNPIYIMNAPDDISFRFFDTDPDEEKELYSDVKCIWIGSNYLSTFDIIPEFGRGFNENDFEIYSKKKTVPIILGSKYKAYYKLGDILKGDIFVSKLDLEVVGFLKENTVAYIHGNGVNKMKTLNEFVIFPLCDADKTINSEDIELLNFIYQLKICGMSASNHSPEQIQSRVSEICNSVGLSPALQVEHASNYESAELMMNMEQLFNIILSASIVLLLFSLFTIAIAITNHIRKNMRYYSILTCCGFTYHSLILIILQIPIICLVLAGFVSIVFMLVFFGNIFFSVIIYCGLLLILISAFIIGIITVHTYRELQRQDISKFLRRR